MPLETKSEVLAWYEKQPRSLNDEFLNSIVWSDVKNHEIDDRLIPVLLYMRDVESLTDMYYSELSRTPTGNDPVVRRFMDRWSVEEQAHADLINRFLCEAGVDISAAWRDQVKREVTRFYKFNSSIITSLTNLVGRKFTATHMTFGAIHEMSTTQGYRRLIKLADHPVLTQILTAIIREESAHTEFYTSIARIELRGSDLAQKIARFVIDKFWQPVGQGSIDKSRTNYVIATLFGDGDGLDWVDKTITQRIRRLPGFTDLNRINETIEQVCADALLEARTA